MDYYIEDGCDRALFIHLKKEILSPIEPFFK